MSTYAPSQPSHSRVSEFQSYTKVHQQIQQAIGLTDAQIKLLNGKILKQDYDTKHLRNLQQQREQLISKRSELEETINSHRQLHQIIEQKQKMEKDKKKSLGYEYRQAMNHKQKTKLEQKYNGTVQQKKLQEFSQRSLQEEYKNKRKEIQDFSKVAEEQILMKNQQIRLKRMQQTLQKQRYWNNYSGEFQFGRSKDKILQQYSKQFDEQQRKLPYFYKLRADQRNPSRSLQQSKQAQFLNDQYLNTQLNSKVKINKEKDMLGSFLQEQIEMKKSQQFQQKQQRIHEPYLNPSTIQRMHEDINRSRILHDQDPSTIKMKSYSSESTIPLVKKVHNPITNPISFKIGITNPYILRQYQQARQKYFGDGVLKINNLAKMGSHSLAK